VAAQIVILVLAGFVSAVVNMVSAGGSFLTLPILIFLGFSPGVANATNRVGVAAQNVVGVAGFQAHGVVDWAFARRVALPCAVGALLGSMASLQVGDRDFRRILAVVMVLMSVVAIVDPGRFTPAHAGARSILILLGSLGGGFYGGFIQAGVGFLILAVTSLGGLDLVRGNAVKVFLALVQTAVSVAVFTWAGTIDWPAGLALGVGCCLGSLFGVRLTVRKGHAWIKRVVTLTVVVFAVLLWFGP
jgi:hypothetical protein